MNSKIIIVEGYLASGKSTFAARLSKAVNIPYLIKDTFKTALCDSLTIADRNESRRFSAVTFDGMMYVAERLIETGCPVIIEGNFVPAGVKKVDEAGVIKGLITKYNCRALTYKFFGDTQVLHKRFVVRDKLPERGEANRMFEESEYAVFDRCCKNLDPFDVGGIIVKVDTTDFNLVDFESHIDTARSFLTDGTLL